MPEHDSIMRVAGAGVLTLAALACAAGVAEALRRGLGRGRGRRVRAVEHRAAVPRPARHPDRRIAAIPGQRRTGPRAESVPLTPQERDAFAGLVRRFHEGGRA
ncbi:hypothetical protein N4P33_31910 [Streptomyces sp. 15-116A]|uniref:hypothetical protein n=1 Tax=Streptomyces sp. 15-116A TaxID=2259035 RepID=UPI0021B20973|nr:hypothetical protein [Streptomyces sp. 15-116A]MCT7356716.1 hypothetical protein [Streptomyces sp. 15-116A]